MPQHQRSQTTVIVWAVLGSITAVAVVGAGLWFMVARPVAGYLDMFSLNGDPRCTVAGSDLAVLAIPIVLANPDELERSIQGVRLVASENLEVVGWNLVRSEDGAPEPPTQHELAALIGATHHNEYVDGDEYWVVAVLESSNSTASAGSVEVLSVTGEPVYADDLGIAVSIYSTSCLGAPV